MNALQRLFTDKLVDNSRKDLLFSFHLPSFLFGTDDLFGFFLPQMIFYLQLIVLFLIQTMMAALTGLVIYQFIIKNQVTVEGASKKDSSPISSLSLITNYLVGFGIVFPFIFYQPIYLIDYLTIESRALKMFGLAVPITLSLRCLEAIFGFTPLAAKKSFKNYMIYSSCLMAIKFDPIDLEPKKVNTAFIKSQFKKLGRDYVSIFVLMTILQPRKFAFFDVEVSAGSLDHTLSDLISWKHLLNNYLVALTLSVSLSQSTLGVSLLYNILYGYQTTEVVNNPVLKSSSPSDFWGRRWNTLVHSGLKNGVYKPMRSNFRQSPIISVFATFFVSGIIHEYVNIILFSSAGTLFKWKNIIFFGWNGMLIASQYTIGQWKIIQWMNRNLPQIVKTSLIILTALPVAHLFTGDWIDAGYFDHVNACLPSISKIV